ncbi:MAG: ROK family protein [Marinilabiliaceae bacterium]|nr:ROK family protein [Marinilabiliaceae bacterium]
MNSLPYISADIGGSHITTAAIDPQSKAIIRDTIATVKVDNQAPSEQIIATWCEALSMSISKVTHFAGIGFAMPGPFDYVNGISKIRGVQKYEALYDLDVKAAIGQRLNLNSLQSVRFINDATAFAIGESWGGLASTYNKIMAITLGTGFGSAFINNGMPVLTGPSVPELGCVYHIPYNNSIADDYFSTRWFVNTWQKRSTNHVNGVKEIADLAIQGNLEAQQLFQEFGNNLGTFLSHWLKKFEADCLIIGGNISNANKLFQDALKNALVDHQTDVHVGFSQMQEEAALLGAARLTDPSYYNKIEPLLSFM